MRVERLVSVALIIIYSSCIDRFYYNVELPQGVPLAVYGHISNQPGPYQVDINTSFDINSKELKKTAVSVHRVSIIDELNQKEDLSEIAPGVYRTSPTGIKGRVGGVYKLRIELHDGKVYESVPDTLLAPGQIDSLYHEFYSRRFNGSPTQYGFDLMVNGKSNSKTTRFRWIFEGTFMALTHPELMNPKQSQCYPIPGQGNKCNFIPLCTGLRNVSAAYEAPVYERVEECTCCICWYKIFNDSPILSDDRYSSGAYGGVKVYDIPLNDWIFMYKIHTRVTQATLTMQSFAFFESIKDQKESVGSLSQPTVGRIPNTFIQIEGTPAPINGIFYSAGMDSKSMYISSSDVKPGVPIPIVTYLNGLGCVSCLDLFPNATTVQPDFWN